MSLGQLKPSNGDGGLIVGEKGERPVEGREEGLYIVARVFFFGREGVMGF